MKSSNHIWIIITLALSNVYTIHTTQLCSMTSNTSCSCNNLTVNSRLSDGDGATKMKQCIEIKFENNSLNIVPTNFFAGLGSLQRICLNGNRIEDIEAGAFSAPTEIEDLNLNRNQLKHIARGWFNSLTHLKYLRLSFNRIETIEEESFHGLHSLKVLNLSNNKLNILPENWFISLKELNQLDVSNNSLRTIDFKMTNLNNLKIMNFSMNNIQDVPDCPTKTTDNTTITSCFPKSLQCINLDHNIISKLEDYSFDGLRNLTRLHLNNNKLDNIPLKLLTSLEQLEHLSISVNDVEELKVGVFSGLQNLRKLHMSNLRIKDLDVRVFTPINHLSHLDISSNNLENLNEQIFSFCPTLESINIEGNKFSCSAVASIVIHSRNRNFTVICSRNFDTENIIGIPCITNVLNPNLTTADRNCSNEIMYNIFCLTGMSCFICCVMLGLQVYYRCNRFHYKKRDEPRSFLTI